MPHYIRFQPYVASTRSSMAIEKSINEKAMNEKINVISSASSTTSRSTMSSIKSALKPMGSSKFWTVRNPSVSSTEIKQDPTKHEKTSFGLGAQFRASGH